MFETEAVRENYELGVKAGEAQAIKQVIKYLREIHAQGHDPETLAFIDTLKIVRVIKDQYNG